MPLFALAHVIGGVRRRMGGIIIIIVLVVYRTGLAKQCLA